MVLGALVQASLPFLPTLEEAIIAEATSKLEQDNEPGNEQNEIAKRWLLAGLADPREQIHLERAGDHDHGCEPRLPHLEPLRLLGDQYFSGAVEHEDRDKPEDSTDNGPDDESLHGRTRPVEPETSDGVMDEQPAGEQDRERTSGTFVALLAIRRGRTATCDPTIDRIGQRRDGHKTNRDTPPKAGRREGDVQRRNGRQDETEIGKGVGNLSPGHCVTPSRVSVDGLCQTNKIIAYLYNKSNYANVLTH